MSINDSFFNKMYYVPVMYFNINEYKTITDELKNSLSKHKIKYYNDNHNISKYMEYKSNIIRLILIDHGKKNADETGNKLLDKIIKKWINADSVEEIKKSIYNRTKENVISGEKTINNIEEIMILISLQMLENYYFC
jgi:tRNA(Ile)-lysidine synthase TilS/MesJ